LDPPVRDLWSGTEQAIYRRFRFRSPRQSSDIWAVALAAPRDYPDLIILMMTGYADRREHAPGVDVLIHDAIAKPFSIADIRFAVASALAVRAHSKR
jgi:CheY-like chemotaxis protein